MKEITLHQPAKLVFGNGCSSQLPEFLSVFKKVAFVVAGPLVSLARDYYSICKPMGIEMEIFEYEHGEPTFALYEQFFKTVKDFGPDCVVGCGGGSVLDLAKILAAMIGNPQSIGDVTGINLLKQRSVKLVCMPTTSGTGSEVSPNAILLDEVSLEKRGIISPFLVPDASFVDPELTVKLPPKITAETGIDALSHCMEAFTNKFSHPLIDHYAIKGVELIAEHIVAAYQDGTNVKARGALSMGSLLGGICLGPVNTAAVHALSYPLGGKYHIPHGLANAVLLAEVYQYNMSADMAKHARLALALGAKQGKDVKETALHGLDQLRNICRACGIPESLGALGIVENDIPEMAALAMKVTRLLKNNPRPLNYEDAVQIYKNLM
ncbi:MAG: iron-containing alcohol dehydrogenase [Cyclobacteriaceae bacterium]|nr:iron-containing alcohol dehydrogenase [Cyclobacteriaceae bacterium]